MATMQVQKTRMMPPTTKTAITQKQSLEVVQTLLLGGLSSLTYMREFFAEKAYDTQFYENIARIPSYKDYASGKLPGRKKTSQGTDMQVLRRHRSKRADLFLDWLEKGAFPALKKGNLHALQICVHLNADDREQVIETYTFTIKYHTDQQSGQKLAGLEIGGPEGPPVTVEATSEAMQQMVRGITKLTERLPSLPDKRWVSMALFYTQDGEKPRQPKGFGPSITNDLRFATAPGWVKNTTRLSQELHSEFHSTTLKVSYLHDPELDAVSDLASTTYPAKLLYGDAITAQADIDILPPQEADAETVVSQTPAQRRNSTSSAIALGDPSIDRLFNHMATPLPTSGLVATGKDLNSPVVPEDDANTQSSVVPRMKHAFGGMMLPERWSQGDTQTQMAMRAPAQSSRVGSRVPDSPNQDETFAPKQQPLPSEIMVLLPKIAQELAAKKAQLRKTALRLARATPPRTANQEPVLCQCGHEDDKQEDSVCCVFCETWQHVHCYGFAGTEDPRLPEDHTCYQCLLGDRDDDTLTKLKELAIQRRAMGFVLRDGLRRKTDLVKIMGIDTNVAHTLHSRLRAYVVNAQNSHKPGFAASGKPPYVPAQPDHPNYNKMLSELFDPLLHIEQYYATRPAISKPIIQQLQALRSISMPPPSTPASVLNKKRNSATPGDGLDIRPSMSPYATPERLPIAKRGREDEEIFDTPAKRHASVNPLYDRLKSAHSEYILNADGKSSSPAAPK